MSIPLNFPTFTSSTNIQANLESATETSRTSIIRSVAHAAIAITALAIAYFVHIPAGLIFFAGAALAANYLFPKSTAAVDLAAQPILSSESRCRLEELIDREKTALARILLYYQMRSVAAQDNPRMITMLQEMAIDIYLSITRDCRESLGQTTPPTRQEIFNSCRELSEASGFRRPSREEAEQWMDWERQQSERVLPLDPEQSFQEGFDLYLALRNDVETFLQGRLERSEAQRTEDFLRYLVTMALTELRINPNVM